MSENTPQPSVPDASAGASQPAPVVQPGTALTPEQLLSAPPATLAAEPVAPAGRRGKPSLTTVLVACVAAVVLFAGGTLTGYQFGKSSTESTSAGRGNMPNFPGGTGDDSDSEADSGSMPGGMGGSGASGTSGTVASVDGTTFTVTTEDGTTLTVSADDATVTIVAEGDVSDLSVGDTVTVTGETDDDGFVTATSVLQGSLSGLGFGGMPSGMSPNAPGAASTD